MSTYEINTTAAQVRLLGPDDTDWWRDYADDPADGRSALVIGHPGALAYAVVGTPAELEEFAARLAARVREAAVPADGYADLDDDTREQVRQRALAQATRARDQMAGLYLAEAAVHVRRAFPTAARLTFDADLTEFDEAPSATVTGVYDAAWRRLDELDDGGEVGWDEDTDTRVREALSAAADWDPHYDGTGVEVEFDSPMPPDTAARTGEQSTRYTVCWATTESHQKTFMAKDLAALLGVSVAELEAADPGDVPTLGDGLYDRLADVEGDATYAGMTSREMEHDGVTRHGQTSTPAQASVEGDAHAGGVARDVAAA